MQISFVRTVGKPDRVYVQRTSGREVSWSFPTFGNELPHDLVHLVVESTFGVRQGFWGRVDAGVDVARINEQANRVGGAGKYAGFGDDLRELYLAEALAAIPWSMPDCSDEDRLSALVSACEKSQIELPASATLERIAEARAALDALRYKWRNLVPSGRLRIEYDPARPARLSEL